MTELFEAHTQPIIDTYKQWGCAVLLTFIYWDIFLGAVDIFLFKRTF